MKNITNNIRALIIFFMVMLFLSGLTAIPVETEVAFLSRCFTPGSELDTFIEKIYTGIANTNRAYPFLGYGYDWLAFAHFVLAILFIGPLRDPLRNKWIIEFGIICCILIVPFALIAGHFRDIPLWWRLIDCSFGIIGLVPLVICNRKIAQLELIINNKSEVGNIWQNRIGKNQFK
jgi:hypothetical protein